jgi:hypothetical protein
MRGAGGKVIREAEPVKNGAARDPISKPKEKKGMEDSDARGHAEMLREHNDRLTLLEDHLGISKKADNMKGEDQTSKGPKLDPGHRDKMRKRH